jgi:hypothetical protein
MARSVIRLNPIAAKRAAVKATRIRRRSVQRTSNRYDASVAPTSANGRAKTVWGSFTRFE